jgi:adenine deaminase
MQPFEFEAQTLPLGTTTAFCDPHEITNVLGAKGFEWFLRCSEKMHQNLFVQVSSCVPALPGFETNAGTFTKDQMISYKDHSNVIGMAEMMNFPGVINGKKEILDKIECFDDLNLDGHSPLLQGKALNAYRASGIQNCHETVTLDEAKEKLQVGMAVMLREGSVAKNLMNLSPIVHDFNSTQCLLCTDDRNPFEIHEEGHINYMVKRLLQDKSMPLHLAYRLSSYSPAKHFGLKRLGLIAPGYRADLIILKDAHKVDIHSVYAAGKNVADLNLQNLSQEKFNQSLPPIENTMKRTLLTDLDFSYDFSEGLYNVIEIIPNEIVTNHLKVTFKDNMFTEKDIKKISVIERYGQNLKPSIGLVKGFGFEQGAIASSVAHDSHNIIVVGSNDHDMAVAANALINSGGGFVIVKEGKILSLLELPIAGLMSSESADELTVKLKHLKTTQKNLGIKLHEPFLQMAFVALPVIPSLKITDKGLVDVSTFKFIKLKVD